jgi:radical SAM superfamily enzyme YgiQ (UPF0313 family)
MKIAFLITSPVTLKHDWYRDPLYQKVGVPNLAGFLRRAGFSDISQYDLNNRPLAAYKETPGLVKLLLYADSAKVKRYLAKDEPEIAAQTRFLLDSMGVERHDLFGVSLSHFLGDEGEIALGINLAKCLAKALKERFPACRVTLGGLQNMSIPQQLRAYRKLLSECSFFDYAVCGDAHLALLYLCRALESGLSFAQAAPAGFKAVKAGKGLLIHEAKGDNSVDIKSHYFEPLPAGEEKDKTVPFGYPAYSRENSRGYSYTGAELRRFYNLPRSCASLLAPADKSTFLTLQVSFNEGCPFGCYFCATAHTDFFSLSPEASVEILKRLNGELGCKHFLFYNPNFNPTPAYARKLLAAIIKAKLDLRWADCFNLRNLDAELVAMMKEAGAVKVVAGVEYPTARMLKYINKGLSIDTVNRNLELLNKAGMWNHVLLITGLPTETPQDVLEMEAWLKDTRDLVNSYTVGSFHMSENSPFQRQPEKFGFKLGRPLPLYCQESFDEADGLAWEEKRRRNLDSNRRVLEFINALKGSPKYTGARMDDSHLLLYLYRALGHKNKRLIERLYEAAWTANPHAARAHAWLEGEEAGRALAARGLRLELAPAGRETVEFTLRRKGAAVRCALRARSENVLLNAAPGRLHGGHFMLEFSESARGARGELPALKAELPAVLAAAEAWGLPRPGRRPLSPKI